VHLSTGQRQRDRTDENQTRTDKHQDRTDKRQARRTDRDRFAPTSIAVALTSVRRIAPTIERCDRTDTPSEITA